MKTDVHLQRDILDEIDWEPSINAAQIGVTVKEGVVTLTGHVSVFAEKHAAEEVAKRVHGTRAVANEIEVRPGDVHIRDDEDLAAAAVHALQWDAKVPADRLQVTVEHGRVQVDGTVDHQYEKAAVDRVLRHLIGVRSVVNSVVFAPRQLSSSIKGNIQAALLRSASLNSRRIDVDVDGPTVTLTGDVHSHSERDEAEQTAWAAQGVLRVQNCLTITPWGTGPAEEWGY